jgi:FtsH-binding integral membrane protein
MKLVVIAFLIVIVASLASALIYLIRDKGHSERTAKALTVRVALSVGLFLLLMIGYYFGIIPRQGF